MIRLRSILTLVTAGATFVALSKLSDRMPEPSAEHRQLGSTPYAALAAPDKVAANAQSRTPAPHARVDPDYLASEADRLEELKQALFTAFVAAPKAGIPTGLVDLAAAYTSALRLQMALRGYSAMPARSAKAPMFATPRSK